MTGLIKPNFPMRVKMIHFHESANMDPIAGPMTVQFVNGLLAVHLSEKDAPDDMFFFVNPADIERMTGVRCIIDDDLAYWDESERLVEYVGGRVTEVPF